MNITKKALSWAGYATALLLLAFLVNSQGAINYILQ